jgi:hypothetical protein
MLSILLIWIYIALISIGLGFFIQKLFVIHFIQDKLSFSFPLTSLLGLAMLSSICNIFSLWLAIGLEVHFFVGFISIIIYYTQIKSIVKFVRKYFFQFGHFSWLIIALSFCFCLLQSTPIAFGLDEGKYYIQTLKWMSEYPIIPGIGNIYPALSYNSNWHILNTFWGFSFLGFQCFNDLNGYLYLLLILYSLEGLEGLFKREKTILNCTKVGFIFFSYFFFRPFVALTSADFAAGMLTWFVMIELLDKSLYRKGLNDNAKLNAIIILSVFAFTVKISAIWILFIPLSYGVRFLYLKEHLYFIRIFSVVLLIIIPHLTRNVISSGYLLNPLTIIDIFHFDWKMPKETEKSGLIGFQYILDPYLTGITHHNRYIKGKDGERIRTNHRINFKEWISTSINESNLYSQGIFILILLSFLMYIGLAFYLNKATLSLGFEGILFFLLLFGGMLLWIFLLPSWKIGGLRIAFGLVMLFVLSPIVLFISILIQKYPSKLGLVLLSQFLCVLQLKNFWNVEDKRLLISNHIILPPEFPIPSTKSVKVENITFHIITEKYKNIDDEAGCWGAKLPCITSLNPTFEPRGEKIEDGFRPKKTKN